MRQLHLPCQTCTRIDNQPYFLTGDIQIGKTRWLEGLIGELQRAGVPVRGVVAPGRWAKGPDGFEKLGIDNVMLPQGARVAFAEPGNPGWRFSEEAIGKVDAHLGALVDLRETAAPGLLVIDELGWMELLEGRGLSNAMLLVDAGACRAFPHALVVVRDKLLRHAAERFKDAQWEGIRPIGPTPEARAELVELFSSM